MPPCARCAVMVMCPNRAPTSSMMLTSCLGRREHSAFPAPRHGTQHHVPSSHHAIEWLSKGVDQRMGTMTYITRPPWFDDVKHDPRYEALLERIGLRVEKEE